MRLLRVLLPLALAGPLATPAYAAPAVREIVVKANSAAQAEFALPFGAKISGTPQFTATGWGAYLIEWVEDLNMAWGAVALSGAPAMPLGYSFGALESFRRPAHFRVHLVVGGGPMTLRLKIAGISRGQTLGPRGLRRSTATATYLGDGPAGAPLPVRHDRLTVTLPRSYLAAVAVGVGARSVGYFQHTACLAAVPACADPGDSGVATAPGGASYGSLYNELDHPAPGPNAVVDALALDPAAHVTALVLVVRRP